MATTAQPHSATPDMNKLGNTRKEDWDRLAAHYTIKANDQPSTAPINVMLERANLLWPFSKATAILDNGCGPGQLTSLLIASHGASLPPSARLLAGDFSTSMLAQVDDARARAIAQSSNADVWQRLQTHELDAQDMGILADASLSHVLANMVYFLVPQPRKALAETLRVLSPEHGGGVFAGSAFESAEWIDVMSLITDVRADKRIPEMPREWTSVAALTAELQQAGFREVEVHRVPTVLGYETHAAIVEFIVARMPHMRQLTADMEESEIDTLKQLIAARLREMHPEEPGRMTGVVLVGLGRK